MEGFGWCWLTGGSTNRKGGEYYLKVPILSGIANSAEKAARNMVAAYLNESAFPSTFPVDSLADLLSMWYAAVAGGDAALDNFHTTVSGWNSPPEGGYCPLP